MMNTALWIMAAAGGAAGAVARYGVTRFCMSVAGAGFPWGTLVVNVAGSVVAGVVFVLVSRHGLNGSALHTFISTGFLGAFTTFSAFSLDVAVLYMHHSAFMAGAYLLASVFLSLAGVLAGLALGQHIL